MKEFYGNIKPYKKGFRRSTLKELAEYLESPVLYKYATSEIYWDSIKSIEYMGTQQTYDLEVKDIHNFIANGIIVHNSHSAAYAMISYRTAYLKANFPTEYMTALLTSETGNTDKLVTYINESKRMGINILPPDVNESFSKFTLVKRIGIRFGLVAVKNVGKTAIDSIIKTRTEEGEFKSLYDFCSRVDLRLVNRKVIESLIKCGAFDSLRKPSRASLVSNLDRALEFAAGIQKDRKNRQLSFFDLTDTDSLEKSMGNGVKNIKEWPQSQLLSFEKQLLGFYVTGHPLIKYEDILEVYTDSRIKNLKQKPNSSSVSIGGMVDKVKKLTTKRNQKMAILSLEDLTGRTEVILFSRLYKEVTGLIRPNFMIFIKGRVSYKRKQPQVIAEEVVPLSEVRNRYTKKIVLRLNMSTLDKKFLKKLKRILSNYLGKTPLYIEFKTFNVKTVLLAEKKLYVEPNNELFEKLYNFLGKEAVGIEKK